jgi:uncharacterized protein
MRGRLWTALLLGVLGAGWLRAQSSTDLPPRPAGYFTDQAGLVDAGTAQSINEELAQFERDTSNQILVGIYPKLPEDAEIAQYTIDTGNAWQAGQKGKDNGAVLLIFAQNHQAFIATGRGLEGALPDITCHEIINQNLRPAFRAGNYVEGLQATIAAMEAAAKGEYQGTGQTHSEVRDGGDVGIPTWVILLFVVLFIVMRGLGFFFPSFGRGPYIYTGSGFGGGNFGSGGGGFSGFSGGGGSFGGGGAGGSW